MKQIQYHYSSPLPKDTILNIISQQKPGLLFSGICGKLTGNGRFEVTYRSGGRNSWNPVFIGIISEEPQQTVLRGTFQTPTFTTVFQWIWRGFVLYAFLQMLIVFLFSPQNTEASPFTLLIPAGMLVFSFILEHVGESQGKESQKEVLKFFEHKLLATPE